MIDTDIAYIAGLLDGEAYIGIKKSKAYACQGRRTPGYHARIQVRMVDEPAIRFLAETLGGWYYPEKSHSAKGRPLFVYQASDASAETILRTVLPYLRVKRRTAETVLELRDLQATRKAHMTKVTGTIAMPATWGGTINMQTKCLSDEYVAACDALYLTCKELNRVGI